MVTKTRRGFLATLVGLTAASTVVAKDTLVTVPTSTYSNDPLDTEALNVLVRELDYTFPEGGYRCFECDWVMVTPRGLTARDKVVQCWNKECKNLEKRYKILPYVPLVEL